MGKMEVRPGIIYPLCIVVFFSIFDIISVLPGVSISKALMPFAILYMAVYSFSGHSILSLEKRVSRNLICCGFIWSLFFIYLLLRWSASPHISARGFSILQSYLFLPTLATFIALVPKNRKELNIIINSALVPIVLLGVLSTTDVLLGADRAYPLGMNPNTLALKFVIGIFFTGFLMTYVNNISKMRVYSAMLFVLLAGILSTGSREGFISLTSGVAIFYYISPQRVVIRERLKLISAAFSVVIFSLYFLPVDFMNIYLNRIISLLQFLADPSKTSGVGTNSIHIRFQLLQTGVDMFLQEPWVGYGIGTFREYTATSPAFNQPRGAHSTYIYILSQAGIVGGCLLFALFSSLIYASRNTLVIARSISNSEAVRASLLICIIISGLVNAIAADVFRWKIFWIGIGISLTYYNLIEGMNSIHTDHDYN